MRRFSGNWDLTIQAFATRWFVDMAQKLQSATLACRKYIEAMIWR